MMRLIVSRSTKKTELQSSLSDPAGADAARWDRSAGRRGYSAPRTSSIISNRPGALVLSTLVVVALSSTLILSSADVSRRPGELSLHDDFADSKFNDRGTGIGAEIRELVHEGEKDIAKVAHKILSPSIPSHEEIERYRGTRRQEYDRNLEQVDYRSLPLQRVEPVDPYDDLRIPRDEHLGVGPMIRDWKFVTAHALLVGAMMHGSAAAAIDPPNDTEKLDAIQKEIKELRLTVGEAAKVISELRGLKLDLKDGLDRMGAQVTDIGVSQGNAQRNINEMREELIKLRGDVETLRTQVQSNASRQSLYPNSASTTDSSTARVEMINTYASEVAFVINRRTYYVAPGDSRTSDPIPAGTFTYEVLGIQPTTTRTVAPNKIFTVRVYTR